MMFFFKKKKIVVDCFTPLEAVHTLYPIAKSIDFYPTEFSKINSYFSFPDPQTRVQLRASTIKRCVGIVDYYKEGFIIPLWTDFICQPRTSPTVGMMTHPFKFGPHADESWKPTGMFSDYIHIKLMSPWQVREKSGVTFTWNACTWNLHKHSKNFIVVPAALSFDVQTQTNINMFVDKNSDPFTISGGTPMIHLVPISDAEVELKTHLVSPEEYDKVGIPFDFDQLIPNRYNRYRNLLKNRQEKQQKKCPFGFGK
jgi:hypothetical protein